MLDVRALVLISTSVCLAGPLACANQTPVEGASPAPVPAAVQAKPEARATVVAEGHPLYGRVEGEGLDNACRVDADCRRAGCSSEVCSAAVEVMTTCEVEDWPQGQGASCGCVGGECRWYRPAGEGASQTSTGATTPEEPAAAGAGQGEKCDDGRCAGGLECIEYYGIAGAKGPRFTSCEIPCESPKFTCPTGQSCVTISDGPGRVCRPAR